MYICTVYILIQHVNVRRLLLFHSSYFELFIMQLNVKRHLLVLSPRAMKLNPFDHNNAKTKTFKLELSHISHISQHWFCIYMIQEKH